MSIEKPVQQLRPIPGGLPFNNLAGPLSPQDALRLPGNNIFKRIYWAIQMMAARRAYVAEQRSIHDFEQMAQEEQHDKPRSKDHHKHHGHIGRQDGGPGHEEGFDAGEIDQFDNGSPEALAMYVDDNKEKQVHWILRIIRIYYITFVIIYNMMGLKRDEKGELTDQALDTWLSKNENSLDFRRLKLHLLNSLSEHSSQFDLTQIQFADRFLNRIAATLLIAGKTEQDVLALNQAQFGKALSDSYTHQMAQMSAVANEMVNEAATQASAQGIALKPALAEPQVTASSINRTLAQMGPAEHPQDHGQQVAMQRLATIKSMFPTVPKPNNAQKRDHAQEMGNKHAHAKKPGHDLAKFNTNAAMGSELQQYANAIGVDPRVLEQGADHTKMKLCNEMGPGHQATQQAHRETTAVPQGEAKAPARAPRPEPPRGKEGS